MTVHNRRVGVIRCRFGGKARPIARAAGGCSVQPPQNCMNDNASVCGRGFQAGGADAGPRRQHILILNEFAAPSIEASLKEPPAFSGA
jgi:hypothetical protein